jgi:hypothetical protein
MEGYDDILVGIFYCLASTFLFWVVNALGKVLAETYPIPLLVFFRSIFALMMCLALASRLGGLRSLKAQRPAALVIRGVVWVLMLACSFASYHLLPIGAQAMALQRSCTSPQVCSGFTGTVMCTPFPPDVLTNGTRLRASSSVLTLQPAP